jgi:hypothetical protein
MLKKGRTSNSGQTWMRKWQHLSSTEGAI